MSDYEIKKQVIEELKRLALKHDFVIYMARQYRNKDHPFRPDTKVRMADDRVFFIDYS